MENGKWKSHIKKAHYSPSNEEQLIKNNDEHCSIYHHYNTQVNHPNYDPEEIITEPYHQLETKTTTSKDLQPSNIRLHLSGKISGESNSRVHSSVIVTRMTLVTSIIRQI